ncbi:hypothetical protein C8Q76DRAFT_803390 [Earliella scabrosa]|nr:hypothetical protein C8Q76DRAFT_803390 [Earliella scabrosa]
MPSVINFTSLSQMDCNRTSSQHSIEQHGINGVQGSSELPTLYFGYNDPVYSVSSVAGDGQFPSSPLPLSTYTTLLPIHISDVQAEAACAVASLNSRNVRLCGAVDPGTFDDPEGGPSGLPSLLRQGHVHTHLQKPTRRAITKKSPSSRGSHRNGIPRGVRPPGDNQSIEHADQRRQFFRFVSEVVGFATTDPDTLTNHAKKRRYLECLEAIVVWLCERIRSAGGIPPKMERRATDARLNVSVRRTILVLRQRELRRLNVEKIDAEQKLLTLRNEAALRPPTA